MAASDVNTIGEPLVPTALSVPPLRMISTRLASVPELRLSLPAWQRTNVPGMIVKVAPASTVTSPVRFTVPLQVVLLVICPEGVVLVGDEVKAAEMV